MIKMIRLTVVFFVTAFFCCSSALADRYLDRAAMLDMKQDISVAPATGYAWGQSHCLRYRVSQPNVLILGDSIFDGWSGYLLHVFPKAVVDARVGRQFSTGVTDYRNLLHYQGISRINTIVLELGTNGTVTKSQVQRMMRMAGNHRMVYWITPLVPRPWQAEVLRTAHWAAAHYKNIRLVRWHSFANGHPNWFWSDGVHPNWDGIQHLVGLLKFSMKK